MVETEEILWCSSAWPVVIAVILVLLHLLLKKALQRFRQPFSGKACDHSHAGGEQNGCARGFLDMRFVHPCAPAGAAFRSNALEPHSFESDACFGSMLGLHKPTADRELLKSRSYPHAAHIHGRKRLWEFRWQVTPKEPMKAADAFFGVEQDCYRPVTAMARIVSNNLLWAVRKICQVYKSDGDDPAKCKGEIERPTIVWSLQTVDQIIITAPGEAIPRLNDPNFSQFGLTRADDRRKFKEVIENLELKPGYTYSFGFWCVSRFIDAVGWQSTGSTVAPSVKFQDIGILPPCYFVFYQLKPSLQPGDDRHLDSRKVYWYKVAYWSSLHAVSATRAAELTQHTLLDSAQRQLSTTSSKSSRARACFCW
mmetsp:Transcript_39603/g.84423  ORF Transcript_39603/g.84423 Transcript_39603/m.84423 type:complete len:367 (+) Transcript_39603:76-1176(+)